MESLDRRVFIKRSSQLGYTAILGPWLNTECFWEGPQEHNNSLFTSLNQVCRVKKEVRIACPELGLAPISKMQYIGRGQYREEKLQFMQSSDWHLMELKRNSEDNGKTWTPWKPIPEQTQQSGQFTKSGGANQWGSGPFDPTSKRLIKPVFQRIFKGDPTEALQSVWHGKRLFWDHGFYQLSEDNGKTWGEALQLKHEPGPHFDPLNWGNEEWLTKNEMYIGNAIVSKNGSVIISATVPVPYRDVEDEKYPSIFPNNYREGCVAGAMCFVGEWDGIRGQYSWEKSNAVFLPRKISSRGLVELDLSELQNGHLLMIMRGSDTPVSPGRKWFSVSKDGGLTWSAVRDMRYNTGEQFYSSASIHRTFRSSKNGKLYWVGNISPKPPKGNYPRHPLYIVEVNEDDPSFIKDTLTVIDDRDPEKDTKKVQMSNFSLVENRETNDVEIYLTRLGENENTWSANAYKYTLLL